jgi:nucleotide-binding universal stress UspA family protein
MVKRILVPLDGSTFAESALPLALSLSRRSGASVELATVHEPVPTFAYDEWETAAKGWSETYLADVQERIARSAGGSISTTVKSGRVADVLRQQAEEGGADLVVMATHGRGAFTRAWLGSVADAFLRHAPCPVLLVRPDEEGPAEITGDQVPGTILVPLDGSDLGESVLHRVAELAVLFDAGIVLFKVVAYPMDIASPYLPHTVQMNQEIVEEAKALAERYLEGLAQPLRSRGLEVDVRVDVDAQAGHGILEAARTLDVGLIAMSTHGRGGVARALLGSTADKVIRGAHRPILVVRPPEDEE